MKNLNVKNIITETLTILTTVFSLCISMAACTGINAYVGIAASVFAAIFLKVKSDKEIMPVIISFLCFAYTTSEYGHGAAAFSVMICGILLVITTFTGLDVKALIFKPAITAIMQAAAITVTVLFTTDYFGIGATGNTIDEMLASYTSLGFHPNWRGVLYGTIVMVIMITLPRKFKKGEKVFRATSAALIVTLILNLFLNPADKVSAINEIGTLNFTVDEIIFPVRNYIPNASSFFSVLICGIAMYSSAAYSLNTEKEASSKDYLLSGSMNVAASLLGFFIPGKIRKRKDFTPATVIAAIIIIVFAVFCKDLIARIPVHSCAVILIVASWQSMKWSYYKTAFNDVASITCLLSVLAFSLLFGFAKGMIFATVFSALYSVITINSKPKQHLN